MSGIASLNATFSVVVNDGKNVSSMVPSIINSIVVGVLPIVALQNSAILENGSNLIFVGVNCPSLIVY